MIIMLMGCLTRNKSGNVYGGAEKSLIGLANWLAMNTSYRVVLVSVEGDVKAYPVNEKVEFKGYSISSKSKIGTHLSMFRNTREAIKNYQPDIVIGFWIHPLFYIFSSFLNKGMTIIYSERNDPKRESGIISKIMRRIVVNKAEGIVFQTSEAQAYFDKSVQKKSTVIHNPVYVDYDRYPVFNDNKNRIVTVGRLNSQKNQKFLINAFSELVKEYPAYTLEIYGEGPLKEELEKEIVRCKMQEKIVLKGAFPDVLDKIYGAEIFVMTSDYEGMPNALLEAMCMGIPVLSSNCPCGGPAELITDGINGYLYETGNINDFMKKLRIIVSMSNKERLIMGKKEKEISYSHSEDEIFNKWCKYIEDCINANNG